MGPDGLLGLLGPDGVEGVSLQGLDPETTRDRFYSDWVTILLAGDKLPSPGPSRGERRAVMEQRVSLFRHVRPLLALECVVSLGEAVTYRTWSPYTKGWVEVLRIVPEWIASSSATT